MGFDACTFVPDGRLVTEDPVLSAAFAETADYVGKVAGGRDGFLDMGSLDCPDAIGFMERALGRRGGPEAGIWLPDELRAMCDAAQWPDPDSVPPDLRWAYWSARKFVEVCVEQGLGIWFF
jgi:hypothetical protein